MDARDWRMRSMAGTEHEGESMRPGHPAELGASARSSSAPTPWIPHFSWSPQFSDFPLPFPGSEAPVPVSIYADTWQPRAATSEPYVPSAPFPIPSAAVIALVLILGSLVTFAAWQFLSGDDDSPGIGVIVTPGATETIPSIIGTAPPVQTPGDGGGEDIATATSGTDAPTTPGQPPTSTTPGDDGSEDPSDPGTDSPGTSEPEPGNGTDNAAVAGIAGAGAVVIESWEGDTLIDIAERWGLSVATLIWANDVEDPGQEIEPRTLVVIPRADGVLHTVQAGETLESIAAAYGVNPWDIVNIIQNEVRTNSDLFPGQVLTIPGVAPASRDSIAWYTVREGDHVYAIATYYGLSVATVAYANELPSTLLIHPGQVLVIPPADGLLIHVEEGESVEAIATRFGIPAEIIRSFPFNGLSGSKQPHPGDWILIPAMDPLDVSGGKGGSDTPVSDPFAAPATDDAAAKVASGWFAWPARGTITQEFGGHHNGLDIANNAWTPITAADGGVVTFSGWNDYGLGYAVGIDHENGFVTWYGHFVEHPAVTVGQRVAQGEWLGPMGSTGNSTGPHLHFVIMLDGVYQNPADYLQ